MSLRALSERHYCHLGEALKTYQMLQKEHEGIINAKYSRTSIQRARSGTNQLCKDGGSSPLAVLTAPSKWEMKPTYRPFTAQRPPSVTAATFLSRGSWCSRWCHATRGREEAAAAPEE